MRVLIFLVVLMSLAFAGQIKAQETAKIQVVKFTWSMYNQRNLLEDRDFLDKEEDDPLTAKIEKQRQKSIDTQSRELAKVESDAKKGAPSILDKIFLFELQIKNLDEKPVKSFIWEYRLSRESSPPDSSGRRFLCVEKIKAGDSKTLKIISYLPPVNVIDASAASEKAGKNPAAAVIINRVEYADGTVWKRPDWDDSKYKLDSPRLIEKLKSSDCTVL
jgi:hypothetical protein